MVPTLPGGLADMSESGQYTWWETELQSILGAQRRGEGSGGQRRGEGSGDGNNASGF